MKNQRRRFFSIVLALTLMAGLLTPSAATEADPLDSASAWARGGVSEAVEKGFVPPDLQSSYAKDITRQEFCRMAVSWLEFALSKPAGDILRERNLTSNPNAFSDTADPVILAAYALDITRGTVAPTATAPGVFSPDAPFDREQAAVMIRNTMRAIGADVSDTSDTGFTDIAAASDWAVDAINYARNASIMSGTSANPPTFGPKTAYTREQSIITFNNISFRELLGGERLPVQELVSAGHIEVLRNDNMTVRAIDGNFTTTKVHNEEDAITVFLQIAPDFLPANVNPSTLLLSAEDIEVSSVGIGSEETFYRLYPTVNGVVVFGSELILVVDSGGTVQGFFTSYDHRINSVNTTPTVTSSRAEQIALTALVSTIDSVSYNIRDYIEIESALIIDSLLVNNPLLAWLVTVGNKDFSDDDDEDDNEPEYPDLPLIAMSYYIYANGARAGEIYIEQETIQEWTNTTGTANDAYGKSRTINVQVQSRTFLSDRWQLRDGVRNITTRNAGNDIIRNTTSADTWTERETSAHANVAVAYDYFKNTLGRTSFDGKGSAVKTRIMANLDNASWVSNKFIGTGHFMFGNGVTFEAALDVVGHEFTHAVINSIVGGSSFRKTLGMWEDSESRSLNEAYADIFGMLVEGKDKTDDGRWLMGEDIINLYAFRNMKNPRDMPYKELEAPAHYFDKFDFSFYHANSNIFSHAVYKMMTDSRTANISDATWAILFFNSLFRLQTDASFLDARMAIINSAKQISPSRNQEGFTINQQNAIKEAFAAVGIGSSEERGNTVGNIVNLGLVAGQSDRIYYSSGYYHQISGFHYGSGLYSINPDGTNGSKLCDDDAAYINVVGDYIYYSNVSDGDKIYKIRTDGDPESRKLVRDESASFITVIGDRIYYSNGSKGGILSSADTNGNNLRDLSRHRAFYINVVGNDIYYSNDDDGGKIYKIKTDGLGGSSKLNENNNDRAAYINVVGDYIYYSNLSDGGKIYKTRTDGSDRRKLNDDYSIRINVVGNRIYYYNENNDIYFAGGDIYVLNTDTDGSAPPQLLLRAAVERDMHLGHYGSLQLFNVVGDHIYCLFLVGAD
ncbi:MAG: DUF5050 domain-containing protein [Oscillospiraceae bacterium]|nr:DUF5050 domain-containing protein [Oscillospiraceae bacterium]